MEDVLGFKGVEMQTLPDFPRSPEKVFGFKGLEMQTAVNFAKPPEKVFGFKGVELIMDYRGFAGKTRKRFKVNG
jgi:hypothetical protein